MIPRSAYFDTAIVNNHQVAFVAEVWSGVGGVKLGALYPIDGDVQGDTANQIRRQASNIVLTDPTGKLVPQQASDWLTPFGHELRLYRGIVNPQGRTMETLPLGVFGITDVEIEQGSRHQGDLTIKLAGSDRAYKVSRAKLADIYTIPGGTNVGTAIQNLISSRVSGLTYNFAPVSSTVPLTTYQPGDDPWAKAIELSASAGLDLYFDPYGICVLTPIVSPTTAPVAWTYSTSQQSIVMRVNRKLTNLDAFNDVVVIGDGVANAKTGAILVEVQDTDPNSPTYVNGPYGRNVTVYRSPTITSVQQATYAAQAILARSIGIGESVEFDAITHPAHEPGDVVQITHLPSGTKAKHVMDKVHHPIHHQRRSTHRTRRVA